VQKGPLVAVKLPGMLIAFRQAEPTGGSEGTVMDHFGFKVRNLAEVLQGGAPRASGGTGIHRRRRLPERVHNGPDEVKIELQEDKTLPVKASAYHLHFLLADYVKLRDWYVETFSLVPRKRGTIETTADAPGMNLSFATSRTPTIGTKGRTVDHIGFEVKNLEAFCKKLEARGVKFDIPFRSVPAIGLNIAYITDPSGVYIELTEGYDKY
jgi:catechol 2,3-dioxygenase-like lactoylglutathione lyase family enzyme